MRIPALTKELIAQSRVIAKGRGIRDLDRLVREHGGKPSLWSKKSSPQFEIEGNFYEYHWFEHHLYPSDLFEVIDSREPNIWITEYGEDGERYSYPPVLNKAGFFEDYFEGKNEALANFWHIINKRLSEAA